MISKDDILGRYTYFLVASTLGKTIELSCEI